MNKSKEIRERLKNELGYNSRQVSVKEKPCTYSQSFALTIRDASVNFNKVEDFAESCEKINRCDYSGEILLGGNTFVNVLVSDEIESEWANIYLEEVSVALAILKHSNEECININKHASIRKDNTYRVQVIFWKDSINETRLGENGLCFSYDNSKSLSLYLYKKLTT